MYLKVFSAFVLVLMLVNEGYSSVIDKTTVAESGEDTAFKLRGGDPGDGCSKYSIQLLLLNHLIFVNI